MKTTYTPTMSLFAADSPMVGEPTSVVVIPVFMH